MKKYQSLARAFMAWQNAERRDNTEWAEKWKDEIKKIINSLPHGAGIDGATHFDFEKSKPNRLVINSEYHVMDAGYYVKWVSFRIIITPAWESFDIRIAGNFGRYSDLKEYLSELFYDDLMQEDVL